MPSLLHQLGSYKPFTAMVVGDFMLDQHVYGAAERLSPDAPVPVLHATKFEDRPGGASNVSLCIRALKGEVLCFGVVGADAEGRTLRAKLVDAGCEVGGIIDDPARPTTIKRSLIGLAQHRHPQKMFRMDIETRDALPRTIEDALLDLIARRIGEVDVVCLEDYNKGVCTERVCARLIELCRGAGKELLVDPAAIEDYAKYRGATAITPNRSEAELATGLDTPLDASEIHNVGLATRLLESLDLDVVVLTLDKHGALVEERGGRPQLVPTIARDVYDVTGAGDMVLAALAGARSNGVNWLDAVRFANIAAGLEVQVFGAQPIPFANIQREVLAQSRTFENKLRDIDDLLVELAVHREAGRRIIFTNGNFDVIHAGHIGYLREAKALGGEKGVLVVAINADEQVRVQKGEGRPVFSAADRADILSEMQCVDFVTVFEEPTVDDLLRRIVPDVYVKGGDYQPHEINEHETAKRLGIELRVLSHRPGLGSRHVIEKMRGKS